MPGPLLTSKLYIPAPRRGLVARPKLLATLENGASGKLTLVCAPAGSGKTTLVSTWISSTAREVAWLSLDAEDNDPQTFLRYLAAALQQIGPGLSWPDGEQKPERQVRTLISQLDNSHLPAVLVLDDYQFIQDERLHALVEQWLKHQPRGLHTVIIARQLPPLSLHRWRGRGQITELAPQDLRFSASETRQFLEQTLQLKLTPGLSERLASHTEGWITGLQLVAQALKNQPDEAETFLTTLGAGRRLIGDYLLAEVIRQQAPPVQAFLLQTCLLEQLSASLCQALTGRPDSQQILEQLAADNLFLQPLDHHGQWFRYHRLLAESLQGQLPPAERARLHRKAADWYALHGDPAEAARQARLAQSASGALVAPEQSELIEPLTERELEVLQLLAQGLSNKAIAAELVIAVSTVKRHINHIYGKLQVKSRTQAIARAQALGIIK